MKYIPRDDLPVLELTRRNLTTLLAKLDDPASQRTLIDPDGRIAVRAVEDSEHYSDRLPGPTLTNGVVDRGEEHELLAQISRARADLSYATTVSEQKRLRAVIAERETALLHLRRSRNSGICCRAIFGPAYCRRALYHDGPCSNQPHVPEETQ